MKYCVLIAGLFMAVPAFAEPTSLQELRTISVNGQVERLVVPDQAILTVNLNAMKKELSDAKAAHDRKLTQLMAIIRDARISEKKMRANNSNVQPQYESRRIDKQNRHESFLVGYRVHSNITITLDDTSKLAGLMDTVANAGFEKNDGKRWGNLMNVRYQIGNPRAVRDDMLTEALANAKAKAENLAAASGVELKGVVAIIEGGSTVRPPMPMLRGHAMMETAAFAAAGPVAPPAGEQQLTATVNVTYEIQ